ncbi:Glycosyl transferase family 8 [Musa troglodytarum]|uniref:Glycosyl transferase family 8 n=1 Tax=Musa troglodytarum TaxID=320322 RepID=A0A9E7JM75_9LILI|nr:Glycosyl transferase family 8 [Musa troglodytarum]
MMGLPILLHVVEPFISETKASMAWHKMHQPQRLGRGRKLPLPSSLQSSPFLPASNHSRGAWAFIYTPAVASAQQSVDSMGSGGGMLKAVASKGLVVKINVALLGFFVFAYVALYDHNATELVSCSSRACHTKKVRWKECLRERLGERPGRRWRRPPASLGRCCMAAPRSGW